MQLPLSTCIYMLSFIISLILDRISKYWAIHSLSHTTWNATNNLSFSLVWNRGISWGMFSFSNPLGFWILTSLITLVIVSFAVYTVIQYRSERFIICELLILSGAISNLLDRLMYGAVVDFIELHAGAWYWPAFNIADMCIVGGVIGIMIKTMRESYDSKD